MLLDRQADHQNFAKASPQLRLRQIEEAIDSITDAFVLYDADGNLIFANSKFKKYYSFNAHLLVPGTSFETLFRNEIKEGFHPGKTLEDEDFIAQRVADFFKGQESATRNHSSGRWMLVTDRITPNGNIVGLRTDITELKEREEEAKEAKKIAEQLARTDVLTGLNNRRAFFELADAVDAQAHRYGHPYIVAMIDIDHFKSINDTWGHKIGDVALQTMGRIISESLRETDILGRIGGEEFAVILPETTMENGALLAERVRHAIEKAVVRTPGGDIKLTTSVGLAIKGETSEPLDKIVANADTALYQAKNNGRNRVEQFKG